MSDGFYRAFEERYYAPREVIKLLRRQYLPFAKPIANLYPGAATFDAGCGRGEWLELMRELELSPFGVDLDDGMLSACIELGLPAQKGDAVSYITTLPNDSQAIISAFHVVEHITFDQLRTLVSEALRVLKPGGLLIMETPNPENIVVATRNFYLDPTHQRPIPSMLLAFLAEYAGFARVKTLRLQENKELVNQSIVSLQDVFAGASPDYAIVAQKSAPDDILALTSISFRADYGLSLENLLNRWDNRFNRLEATSNESLSELQAVYASRSWKITRPLRDFNRLRSGEFDVIHRFAVATKLKSKEMLRPVIAAGINYVNKRPALRVHLKRIVSYFPSLRRRLIRIVHNSSVNYQRGVVRHIKPPLKIRDLTPRAKEIYYDLKLAIEKNTKGSS